MVQSHTHTYTYQLCILFYLINGRNSKFVLDIDYIIIYISHMIIRQFLSHIKAKMKPVCKILKTQRKYGGREI